MITNFTQKQQPFSILSHSHFASIIGSVKLDLDEVLDTGIILEQISSKIPQNSL